jgi:hypothetical protein
VLPVRIGLARSEKVSKKEYVNNTTHDNRQLVKGINDMVEDPSGALPFATCFVCMQQGHLAGNCPQKDEAETNVNGKKKSAQKVQTEKPCSFCGSLKHKEIECNPTQQGAGNVLSRLRFLAKGT